MTPPRIPHDPHFHYHLPGDPTRIASAQRGTIVPTWGDRQRAAWRDSGSKPLEGLARFSHALRRAGLETRRGIAVAERKLSKGSALLARTIRDAGSDEPAHMAANAAAYQAAHAAANARFDIRNVRLDAKRQVGKSASLDELRVEVAHQNRQLQAALREKGLVPTEERLSDAAHNRSEASYLLGKTGHRVQQNLSQAPSFARTLAKGASALHDREMRGLPRAAQKAALGTGAVGYALLQAVKRGTYGALKHLADPGSSDRTTFDRRGDAAAARSRMAFAALRGTHGLNGAVDRESALREAKVGRTLSDYRPASAAPGTSPVAVGWAVRGINEYIAASDKPNGLVAHAAGVYLALRNLGPAVRNAAHNVHAGMAEGRAQRAEPGGAKQAGAAASAAHYRGKALKAALQMRSNDAAAKGTLEAEVASQQNRLRRTAGMPHASRRTEPTVSEMSPPYPPRQPQHDPRLDGRDAAGGGEDGRTPFESCTPPSVVHSPKPRRPALAAPFLPSGEQAADSPALKLRPLPPTPSEAGTGSSTAVEDGPWVQAPSWTEGWEPIVRNETVSPESGTTAPRSPSPLEPDATTDTRTRRE